MTATRTTLGAVLGAVLLIGLLAGPAAAHVTADPDSVDEPSFDIAFQIEHGCEGSPTTAVRVQIPEGVEDATPHEVPGWEIELVQGGDAAAGSFTEVGWVGGSLPDGQVGEFGLSGLFAEAAGDVVYFPLVQECAQGEHRWIDIPASLEEWGELEEPAPFVRLAFREGEDSGDPGTGATEAGTEPEPGEPEPDPTEPDADAGATEPEPTEPEPTGTEATGTEDDAGATPEASPVAQATAGEEDGDAGGTSPLVAAGVVAALVALGAGLYAASRTRRG